MSSTETPPSPHDLPVFAVNENPKWFDEFRFQACGSPGTKTFSLEVFEWNQGPSHDSKNPVGTYCCLDNVSELRSRPKCDLRIICVPHDVPQPGTVNEQLSLFRLYQIPPSFLGERLQSVSHSFCARNSPNGLQYLWFHFLCKWVQTEPDSVTDPSPPFPERLQRLLPRATTSTGRTPGTQLDRACDKLWARCGFILITRSASDASTEVTATSSRSPVNLLETTTLICFWAPENLLARFQQLQEHRHWEKMLEDPHLLFDVIWQELWLFLDRMIRNLGPVFNRIELDANPRDYGHPKPRYVDFEELHHLARHVIYMGEATASALTSIESLQNYHAMVMEKMGPSPTVAECQASLRYMRELMRSTQARVSSLDKRIQNIINLSFNLVSQQDSHVMKKDSGTMKTIAIMTLIFLPPTTVATIFGSPFFTLSAQKFHASGQIWIFCAVSGALMVIVLLAWGFSHMFMQEHNSPQKRRGGQRPLDGRFGVKIGGV